MNICDIEYDFSLLVYKLHFISKGSTLHDTCSANYDTVMWRYLAFNHLAAHLTLCGQLYGSFRVKSTTGGPRHLSDLAQMNF